MFLIVLLEPYLPSDFNYGEGSSVPESCVAIHLCAYVQAVSPDGFGELVPVACSLRQPIVRKALSVAETPRGCDLPTQPIWGCLREDMQGVMQRFAHNLQTVELPDGRHNVGRIGTLWPTCGEETPRDHVGAPLGQ